MKKVVRLTESQLHKVITESVRKILRETESKNAAYKDFCDIFAQKLEELGFEVKQVSRGKFIINCVDVPYHMPFEGEVEIEVPVDAELLFDRLFEFETEEEVMRHIQDLTEDEVYRPLESLAQENAEDYFIEPEEEDLYQTQPWRFNDPDHPGEFY